MYTCGLSKKVISIEAYPVSNQSIHGSEPMQLLESLEVSKPQYIIINGLINQLCSMADSIKITNVLPRVVLVWEMFQDAITQLFLFIKPQECAIWPTPILWSIHISNYHGLPLRVQRRKSLVHVLKTFHESCRLAFDISWKS